MADSMLPKTMTNDDSGNVKKRGGSMTRGQYAETRRKAKPKKAKK